MIPFSIPDYDSVDPNSGVMPPEDWVDVCLTNREAKESKKGSPMMVCEFTIDNGGFSGIKLSEYIVFGMQGGFGEAKLKKILEAHGGFPWKAKPTLEEFVAQFPVNHIRVGALVQYDYQVKNDDDRWESVSKAKYEASSGKKSIKAQIADFRGAALPAAVKFTTAPVTSDAFQAEDNLPF